MAKKEERFIQTYTQGVFSTFEVLVDRQTGVNYLFRSDGNAGGLTVLLNRDGTPIVTPVPVEYDD